MSAIESIASVRIAKEVITGTCVLGALAAGIWAIVFSSTSWQRGIYAGMHGNDARNLVSKQMTATYGGVLLSRMRYAGELKTHLVAGSLGPQMRVFRFIGPNGTRYCASEWPTGNSFVVNIRKGCKF